MSLVGVFRGPHAGTLGTSGDLMSSRGDAGRETR